MTQKDFGGNDTPGIPPAPPAGGLQGTPALPPPRKRRSKLGLIVKILFVLVIALILLVLAAPTLLSSGPVVSSILGSVNKQLNGRVEVSSLSLGWFSGVKVDGVKVFDAANSQIAQVDHAVVPYPLWKAVTGNLAFGGIVLDGVSFDAKVDSNGQLNFAQLAKPSSTSSSSSPAPAAPSSPSESKPSKLPAISLNLKLSNCTGTFAQAGKPTVYLTKLDGEIKIPDINQPISDQINAAVKVNDKEGTLSLSGTAAVINQNQIAIDSAQVHQKLDIDNLDLETAKPFIPASAGVETIDGVIGVHVSIDLTDGKNATVDAAINGSKPIAIGGKVLQGDTFSTNTFTIAIPKLTAAFPDGLDKWQSGRIKVGTDAGSSPILVKIDQGQITAAADVVPQAILNLIAKDKPGSTGTVAVTSSFDLAKIIPQLKHTIPQAEGVLIQTAGFDQKLTLAISPDNAVLSNSIDTTKVVGTQKVDGATKTIAMDPIHLSVSGNDLGGGGSMPKLADLNLKIQSSFANGDFHGDSISNLTGTLKANLKAVQTEISQFVDLKKTNFAGDVEVTIADKGQLTQAPDFKAGINLNVTVHDLKYGNETGELVDEPLVLLALAADLQGSATNTVETVKNFAFTLKTGSADAPTVNLEADAPSVNLMGDRSAVFTTQITADLEKLQKELAAVPAGKAGVVVNKGTLTLNSQGKYSGHTLTLEACSLNAEQLFIARQLADGKQLSALAGEALHLNLAGNVVTVPTADGKSSDTTVQLKSLSLTDIANILDIHKSDTEDFVVNQTAAGGIGGQGKLALTAQLGSLNSIQKILGQNELTVKTTAGDLQSGTISGELELLPAGKSKTSVNADLILGNLVVTTATGTLPAQSANVTLKATADQAANTVAIDQASVKSNLATATITGANLSLAATSVFDQLQSAAWQVDVPNIKPVMDLANAFSASPTPAAAAKTDPSAPKPTPLVYDSGAISLKGDVSHAASTMNINVSQVTATNVTFHAGDIRYTAKPVNASLVASISTGDGKTVMDQIRQVQITQLTGDLGIAKLTMPTPIAISNLSTSPVATGAFQLTGNLTDLTQLVAAMGGQKPDAYPYRGDYTVSEDIGTQQNTIKLNGGLQISKFQSYNGNTVTFSEDLVSVVNDVSLTSTSDNQSVAITSLSAAMQSSGALNLSLKNGSINNLKTTRDMQLQPSITYDLAKLWVIVQPMMGDSYKTLKITGQATKQFNVNGSYPANQPSTVAIKTLHADGDLEIATFNYDGIDMQKFIVPVLLDKGLLQTVYNKTNPITGAPTTAPAAVANSGKIDVSQLTIDLTQDPPRLTTPNKKVLIDGLTVNPVFAGSFLANVINNPLFAGAKDASGLCHFEILDCTNLPMGNLVTLPSPDNTGKIDLTFSLTDLQLGLPSSGLESILKQTTFTAQVNNATVSIAKGIATEDVVFSTGQYNLEFKGSVRLKDQAFVPMELYFPLRIIAVKTGLARGNVGDYLPDTIVVPVEGTVSNPKYRFDKVIPRALRDAGAKALTSGLLGGNKNNGGNGNNNGKANPLNDLLKGLQQQNQQPQH
jgi:hypothetical protein